MKIIAIILGAVTVIGIIYFTIWGNFIHVGGEYNPEIMSRYGGFIGGTAGILFSLVGYILIYEGLIQSEVNQFENSFFTIYNCFNDFRSNHISLKYNGEIKTGVEFFDILFIKQFKDKGLSDMLAQANYAVIKSQLENNKNMLTQYLGNLSLLLTNVYESKISSKRKRMHLSFISSILTGQEKFLIVNFEIYADKKYFKYIDKFISEGNIGSEIRKVEPILSNA